MNPRAERANFLSCTVHPAQRRSRTADLLSSNSEFRSSQLRVEQSRSLECVVFSQHRSHRGIRPRFHLRAMVSIGSHKGHRCWEIAATPGARTKKNLSARRWLGRNQRHVTEPSGHLGREMQKGFRGLAMRQIGDLVVGLVLVMVLAATVYFTPRFAAYMSTESRDPELQSQTAPWRFLRRTPSRAVPEFRSFPQGRRRDSTSAPPRPLSMSRNGTQRGICTSGNAFAQLLSSRSILYILYPVQY